MMQFAQEFPDIQIVSPLATQLSWSHFMEVLPIGDEIQREFYPTMAVEEKWSIRTFRRGQQLILLPFFRGGGVFRNLAEEEQLADIRE